MCVNSAGISSIPSSIVGCSSLVEFYMGSDSSSMQQEIWIMRVFNFQCGVFEISFITVIFHNYMALVSCFNL